MKRSVVVASLVLAFVGVVGLARAADEKADPSGTWKWQQMARKNASEVVLKLKLEGDKVTGTISGRAGSEDTKISDGKFKDGMVSFTVVREGNKGKVTTKYSGKLDKDTIKGSMETERGGNPRKTDWEAKREVKKV